MKKNICIALIVALCLLLLAGCGCEHQWLEADCDSPVTCALCEETEGAPLGHSWMAATCAEPKTCENCGATEGEAKGHFWEEANCTQAKTCNVCKTAEGEALGHSWEEATTEAPKTCTVCQLTEGEKLDVDPRFTTAATKDVQGLWSTHITITGEMLEMEDYIDKLDATLYLELCNDGTAKFSLEPDDYFAFKEMYRKMIIDTMYDEFASMGIGQNKANEAMEQTYGMSIEKFADETIESLDLETIFTEFYAEWVYYVEDGLIYMGEFGWSGDFESSDYTLEDDVLVITEETLEEGGDPLVWTRAAA